MSNSASSPDIATPARPECGVVSLSTTEISLRVRRALRQDLSECQLSREEVALQLSLRAGRVSAAMLDAYVAESKTHRFPVEMIPAWIEVTGSQRILHLLCGEMGLSIATQEDQDFAQLARVKMIAERLEAKLAGKV